MEQDHKELLIGLIGSTYGELKRLDDSIVGSSSTLNRRSDEVKKEMGNILKGLPSRPDVPILQAINHQQPPQPQAVPTNLPVQPQMPPPVQVAPTPPQVIVQQPVDDNQLLLDLNKQTRYEDIINEIDRIYLKLNKLEDKIDNITKILNERKKKVGSVGG